MKGILPAIAMFLSSLCFGIGPTPESTEAKTDAAREEKPKGYIEFTPYTKLLEATRELLNKKIPTLKPEVADATLAALECAKQQGAKHNNVLVIIDYSLPSNQKRLWVIDLEKEKLLYHTYVSHAIKSGSISSHYFSNKNDSKASSLGVFHTENKYYGRYGPALKLQGIDPGFNDKAYKRFIVLHGSWYTTDQFIQKYGRAGRSWGCPTVPIQLAEAIVEAIKDKAFMVVYYPENKWLKQSTFLNCANLANHTMKNLKKTGVEFKQEEEKRDPVVFSDTNSNNQHDKFEPIVVIRAEDYTDIFKKKAPLTRMVRRQIYDEEYIALNRKELNKINKENLSVYYFVVPEIVRKNGRYFQTKIIFIEKQPANTLKSTDQFIRWLGL